MTHSPLDQQNLLHQQNKAPGESVGCVKWWLDKSFLERAAPAGLRGDGGDGWDHGDLVWVSTHAGALLCHLGSGFCRL